SPGCSPPCFMGIHPGTTTAEQAIDLLQASPWVKGVSPTTASVGSGARPKTTNIYWSWSGQQPDFVFAAASREPPYLHVRNDIVQYIRLVTRIPYGNALLIVGAPDTRTLIVGDSESVLQSVGYLRGRLVFDSQLTCPLTSTVVWNTPISITYS